MRRLVAIAVKHEAILIKKIRASFKSLLKMVGIRKKVCTFAADSPT